MTSIEERLQRIWKEITLAKGVCNDLLKVIEDAKHTSSSLTDKDKTHLLQIFDSVYDFKYVKEDLLRIRPSISNVCLGENSSNIRTLKTMLKNTLEKLEEVEECFNKEKFLN